MPCGSGERPACEQSISAQSLGATGSWPGQGNLCGVRVET